MIKIIKNKIFDLLEPTFTEKGFKLKKTKNTFIKNTANAKHKFLVSTNAKRGYLSATVTLFTLPTLLNQTIEKDLGLERTYNFSFGFSVPSTYYGKNAYSLCFHDKSLDIPEKSWLQAQQLSLAEYLHPDVQIEAGTEKIKTILEEVAMPYFDKMNNPTYLAQLVREKTVKELFSMLYHEHHVGWRLLYLAQHYCPERVPVLRQELLEFSKTKMANETWRKAFVNKMAMIK